MKKITFSLIAIIISAAAFASGHVASILSSTNTCSGTCSGTITGAVSGGIGPFGYAWTGPSAYMGAGITIGNLCAGTYTLTVTDSSDLSIATATATIQQPSQALSGTIISQTSVNCTSSTGSFTVAGANGFPPYTYTINGITFQASGTFNSLSVGTYVVTIMDNVHCTITIPVTITQVNAIIPTISGGSPICAGNCVNLSSTVSGGTPSYTYHWAPVFSSSPSLNDCPAAGTNYTLTVTDANGCMGTATSVVNVNPLPYVIPISSPSSTLCTGSPVIITGTCASTYTMSGGQFIGVSFTPTATTTYTVTGVDVNGCINSAPVTISVTNTPVATFSYTGSPYCQSAANPLPTFSGGGTAGTYSSTAGLSFANSSTGEILLAGSNNGTYTVTNTIPASGSCSAVSATSTITINPLQDSSFHYTTQTYCQSGTNPIPIITGTPGGTFTCSVGFVFMNTATGQINLALGTTGTDVVTYTTPGPCATSMSTNITITNAPSASFSYTASPYCQTAANPSATFTGGGTAGTFSSTPGLTFISTASGQVNLAGSNSGTYIVTNTIPATPAGCPSVTATSPITINSTVTPDFTIVPDSVSGYMIQIFNPNSNSGATYSWDFGDGSALGSGLSPSHTYSSAGNYVVTLSINSGGCGTGTLQHSIVISGTANSCQALFNIAKDTLSGNANAYTVTNLSYGSNLTYTWNFGDTTSSTLAHPTHSYLGAGPYQLCLTVNNGAGCTQTYCDSLFAVGSLHAHLDPIAITVVNRPAQGTTVGINESSINTTIDIAPNPFPSQTTISFSEEQTNTTIKITDILGKEIKALNFSGTQCTIEKGTMQAGIYFVQITSFDKLRMTLVEENRKVVVQ